MKKLLLIATCIFSMVFFTGFSMETETKLATYTADDGTAQSFRYEVPTTWECLDKENSSVFVPDSDNEIMITFIGTNRSFEDMQKWLDTMNNNVAIDVEYEVLDDEVTDDDNHRRLIKYTRVETDGDLYEYGYIYDFLSNGIVMINTSLLESIDTNPYEEEMQNIVDTIKCI